MKKSYPILVLLFAIGLLEAQSTFQKTIHLNEQESAFLHISSLSDKFIGVDAYFSALNGANLISAFDFDGNIEWSYAYQIDNFELFVDMIISNQDDEVFILAQETFSQIEFEPQIQSSYVIKLQADGSMLWDKKLSYPYPSFRELEHIMETSDGELTITGGKYVLRLDSDGEKRWDKELLLGSDFQYYHAVAMEDNSITIIGTKPDTELFNEGNINFNTVLCNVDEHGNIQWSKVIKGVRPSHIRCLPNGDLLVFGYTFKDFRELKFLRLKKDGQLLQMQHLPIRLLSYDYAFSTILSEGAIICYFVDSDRKTNLLKLNQEGEFEWGRVFPASGNNTINWHLKKSPLTELTDKGILTFYDEEKGASFDELLNWTSFLRKTDAAGRLEHCYYSSFCLNTNAEVIPESIELFFSNRDAMGRNVTTISPANGRIIPIKISAQDFCEKPQLPSPYFALADTICVNSTPNIDSLCQEQADTWLWKIDGRAFSSQTTPEDFIFETAGLYELTHIIETDACRDTFSRKVQAVAAPKFNIGQDSVLCEDEPLHLDITQGNLAAYSWSDSLLGAMRTINESGFYTAFAEDAYCRVSASRKIDFIRDLFPENPIYLGEDTTICQQIPLVLSAVHPQASDYLWEDKTTNPARSIVHAGRYHIQLNIEGCSFEDEIVIETEDCAGKLYIPTAFSPNNDGQNDHFTIGSKNAEIKNIQIFNRWGALVHEGTEAWSGHIGAQAVQAGLYIYTIEYSETLLGTRQQVLGEVLVMH